MKIVVTKYPHNFEIDVRDSMGTSQYVYYFTTQEAVNSFMDGFRCAQGILLQVMPKEETYQTIS